LAPPGKYVRSTRAAVAMRPVATVDCSVLLRLILQTHGVPGRAVGVLMAVVTIGPAGQRPPEAEPSRRVIVRQPSKVRIAMNLVLSD